MGFKMKIETEFNKQARELNKIGLRNFLPISYKKYLELQEDLKNKPEIKGLF